MRLDMQSDRVIGLTLIALLILSFIAAAISGSDTSSPFDGELARLGQNSDRADAGNVAIRAAAGVGILAVSAVLYTALRGRSFLLAAIASFTLGAAGVLTLVANALHRTLAGIADDFTAAGGSQREDLLLTGRTLAVLTEEIVSMTMIAVMTAIVTLAVMFARERIAPRWLAVLPAIGIALLAGAPLLQAGGSDRDGAWLFFMAGVCLMALWLLVAGCYLIASPGDEQAEGASGRRIASATTP